MRASSSKRQFLLNAKGNVENEKVMRIFGQILLLVLFAFGIMLTARAAFLSAFAKSPQDSASRARNDLQVASAAPSSGITESPDSRSSGGAVLKRPKSRALSAKETKRILDTTQHSLDQELSRITLSDAFDLADRGVLLRFENGKGRLYESKIEFRAMLEEGGSVRRSGSRKASAVISLRGKALRISFPN